MLQAASTLLVEGGPEALKPTHVAARAAVPVGSVYQYFGNRRGLLRVLVDEYYEDVGALVAEELAGASTFDELQTALERAAWRWYELHRNRPDAGPLLTAILADPELQAVNLEDSHRLAALLQEVVVHVTDVADQEELRRRILLLVHLFASALQVCQSVPDVGEQKRMFASWVGVVRGELERSTRPTS